MLNYDGKCDYHSMIIAEVRIAVIWGCRKGNVIQETAIG